MKKTTLLEKRRKAAASAMPEVKRLVKKFGRTAVANCLLKLREHDKMLERLEAAKKEVAKLEREI